MAQANQLTQLNVETLLEFLKENEVDGDLIENAEHILQVCGFRPYLVDLDENAWGGELAGEINEWLENCVPDNTYASRAVIGAFFFKEYDAALQCYLKFKDRAETFWF